MEDITDAVYKHAKKVWKDAELKNLGKYHDLYVQSNTLLLADIFESVRSKCIEVYKLDLAPSLLAPRLAWHVCLTNSRKRNRRYDAEHVTEYIDTQRQIINT